MRLEPGPYSLENVHVSSLFSQEWQEVGTETEHLC
jgi:hypothetical protein